LMDMARTLTLDDVKAVVVEVLGVEDRASTMNAETPLLGGMPELDSMAVVELVAALEARFGIVVEDDEVTAEVFETLGSLAALVDDKLAV
jgi:acyl carrier protein